MTDKEQFKNTIYLLCFLEEEINKQLIELKHNFNQDQITAIEDYVFTKNIEHDVDALYELLKEME